MFLWWHLRRLRDNQGFPGWAFNRDAGRLAAQDAVRRISAYRGNPRAIAALTALLDHEDSGMRLAAASALREAAWVPPSVAERAKLLIAARQWAGAVELGEPAMKPLADMLRRAGEWHGQIVDALGGKSCPAAVEPLRVILERGALSPLEFSWREKAAETLGTLATAESLDTLIENVHLPWVPRVLLAHRSNLLMSRLMAALEHGKPGVRAGAAGLLGDWGDARAAAPLLAAFRREAASDPLPFTEGAVDVRAHVGTALQKLGTAALNACIEALGEEDPQLRACAASVLEKVADVHAADALLAALERDRAAAAQGRYGGWSQSLLAITAALGAVKDARAIGPLAACLSDASLKAVGETDARGRFGLASDGYEAGSWWRAFAEAALGALGRLGAQAVPVLARSLADADAHVRMRAAQALGQAGDKAAAPQLIAMLESEENEQARRAAAEAVQRLTEAG